MSHQEHAAEIGKLLIEHGERRKHYAIIVGKLKDIQAAFIQQQALMMQLGPDNYAAPLENLKLAISNAGGESAGGLVRLFDEYEELRKHLSRDLETLREYGVK